MEASEYQTELERRITAMEDPANLGEMLEAKDWTWLLLLGIGLPILVLIWGVAL